MFLLSIIHYVLIMTQVIICHCYISLHALNCHGVIVQGLQGKVAISKTVSLQVQILPFDVILTLQKESMEEKRYQSYYCSPQSLVLITTVHLGYQSELEQRSKDRNCNQMEAVSLA